MELFFDTETTGLPKSRNARNHDVDNWPRLVQLAWILRLDNGFELHRNRLVIPWGFTIPAEATEIHRITTEQAELDGISIKESLLEFMVAVDLADILIGHGVYFDKSVIGAELIREGMESEYEEFKSVLRFDTMQKSTKICALPHKNGRKGYKWPTLVELYKHLFLTDFDNAHNAMVDVEATVRCYDALKVLGVE